MPDLPLELARQIFELTAVRYPLDSICSVLPVSRLVFDWTVPIAFETVEVTPRNQAAIAVCVRSTKVPSFAHTKHLIAWSYTGPSLAEIGIIASAFARIEAFTGAPHLLAMLQPYTNYLARPTHICLGDGITSRFHLSGRMDNAVRTASHIVLQDSDPAKVLNFAKAISGKRNLIVLLSGVEGHDAARLALNLLELEQVEWLRVCLGPPTEGDASQGKIEDSRKQLEDGLSQLKEDQLRRVRVEVTAFDLTSSQNLSKFLRPYRYVWLHDPYSPLISEVRSL